MKMRSGLVVSIWLGLSVFAAKGADWPQWRGPDRTDVSQETGLLKKWPKQGPTLLWTFANAGIGYSGPAIVGDRLYTMGARDDAEYVLAIDIPSGKEIWAAEVGSKFVEKHGDGPRCTPTVDGDFLYALGANGALVCLETATGKKHWQVNLQSDLGGRLMSGWGYSESPLVDGDQVICTPGGNKGALAALDKKSGKVLWRSKKLTDLAGYSSIIVAEVDGVRQYIQSTSKGVAGVAPKDGALLWYYGKSDFRTAVIPTPIYHDHYVYVTAGYGAGCDLIKLTPDAKGFKAEKIYANKNMVNHHGGVVLLGENLFGYSDGARGWICQDFKTGNILWQEKQKLKKGSLTCADGMLYCYGEDKGIVALVQATPSGWKESGRFTVPRESSLRKPEGRFWTHPVVANGRLYIRDQDLIFCFDIADHVSSAR